MINVVFTSDGKRNIINTATNTVYEDCWVKSISRTDMSGASVDHVVDLTAPLEIVEGGL